jgi:hypothetical protein
VKIKVSKEIKRSARQEWHRRFMWLPRKVNLDGQGQHVVWLETVEARYSKTLKRWVFRDPANDYSNVVSFDLPDNDARQAVPSKRKESVAI